MKNRICALLAGACLLTASVAHAGIEDFVTGGAFGYLDSSTTVMMGGPAKAGQTQRAVVELSNSSAQAFCGVTNFFADDDFYVTGVTAPGAESSFFDWVPPADMVYVVICVQYAGVPGFTLMYGRRFQPMSLDLADEGVAARTLPLPLFDDAMQRLREAADAVRR